MTGLGARDVLVCGVRIKVAAPRGEAVIVYNMLWGKDFACAELSKRLIRLVFNMQHD